MHRKIYSVYSLVIFTGPQYVNTHGALQYGADPSLASFQTIT